MTLNLILRQCAPSEHQLRHKQIVFQPPASSRLQPTHLARPCSDGWGFKGQRQNVMRTRAAYGLHEPGLTSNDPCPLHLKRNTTQYKNSCILFIRSRAVEPKKNLMKHFQILILKLSDSFLWGLLVRVFQVGLNKLVKSLLSSLMNVTCEIWSLALSIPQKTRLSHCRVSRPSAVRNQQTKTQQSLSSWDPKNN